MQIAITRDDKVVELNDDGTWRHIQSSVSCLEKCRAMQQSAEAVTLFGGLFERLGIHIIDTDEKFICIHRGDRVDFEAGMDENAVDFGLQIYSFQIDRVVQDVADGYHDELARFYVARELFPTASFGARNPLNHPLTSNVFFRRMIRGKNLVHAYLLSPDPSQVKDAMYTLFFINGHWHVARGLYGAPERVFRIPVEDAWDLQRHIYSGMKSNTWKDWYKIAKWYLTWRQKVEA